MASTPVVLQKIPTLWPLWPGPASAACGLVLEWVSNRVHQPVVVDLTGILYSVCMIFLTVYYFMLMYRVTLVMETQPDWWGSYTPAEIVWKQFIPIYGLFVLYRWLKEVERYLDWRIGDHFRVGLLTFFAILISSIFIFFNDDYGEPMSLGLAILSFLPVYRRLKQAISILPPSEGWEPGNHRTSTLGL